LLWRSYFPDIAKVVSYPAKPFLGGLSVDRVALGMIAFTIIMFVDIAPFGRGMRKWDYRFCPDKYGWRFWSHIFSLIGFLVLFALCALL
jgi:hypothetical protein